MEKFELSAKQIKKIHTWLRAAIQLLYFIFLPSVYTAAFAGVKYIFTQLGAGQQVAMTSFVTILFVVCGYTFLFGGFSAVRMLRSAHLGRRACIIPFYF